MAATTTLRQRPPLPHKAGGIGFDASLTPDVALQRVTAACLAQLEANTPGALAFARRGAGGDSAGTNSRGNAGSAATAEHVHQMRVALRRLRCAWRFFDSAAARYARKRFGPGLRRLARVLGEQRNWDVFITSRLPHCGLAPGPLARARRQALQRRSEARQRVHTWLTAPAHGCLLVGLQRWLASLAAKGGAAGGGTLHDPPPAEKSTLRKVARKGLARLQRGVKRGAKHFLTMPDEERHAVRINVKRLRYAADVTGALFEAAAVKRFTTALAALQQLLGELTDISMARTMVRSLGLDQAAVDGAQDALRAQEVALLRALPRRFVKVQAAAGFWKRGHRKQAG